MGRVLLKKGWADLRSRKLQSLLAAIIIGAAAGLGVLAVSITQSASSTYSSVLNQANGGHAWVLSDDAAPLTHLTDIPGVVAASGPFARADATLTSTTQTHSLVLWGMTSTMPTVAPALVRQGHWLDGGADEAVIDRGLADKAGLSVGSSLTVSGVGGSRTLRIVGIGVNTTDAPYPLSDPADVFTSSDIVQSVSGGHLDPYGGGVRLADPGATQSFIAAFAKSSGQSAELTRGGVTWQSIRDQIGSGDKALVILLRTFAVFAFFAVGFVLANAVSGQVLSQYRDIGLLRAAGLTPRQVTTLLLAEQLVLAVVAATAGAFLGVFATPFALGRVSNLLDTTPPDPFNPAVMALVVAFVTLEVLVFTVVPAWRGGRVSTVQALTVGPSHLATHPSRLAAWSQRLRLPVPAVIGLKDLFSRPGRAWLSVAALVLAFSTVASALTIESTVRAISDDPLRIGRPPYQLELTAAALDGSAPLSDAAIRSDALAQPGVQSIVTLQRLPGTVDGGNSYFDVDALSGDLSKMPYPIISGRMIAGPGEAVIALNVAHNNRLKIGDNLTLGILNGPSMQLRVVGTVASEDNDGQTVLYSLGDLAKVAPTLASRPATIAVRVRPGQSPNSVATLIRSATAGQVSVNNRDATFRSDLASRAHDLRSVTVPLTVSLIVIAFINLVSTLAFAIRERVPEFGILKTIGYTPRQIYLSVAVGSCVLSGIAALIGAPLGYVSTALLVNHFGEQGGWPAGVAAAPPLSWVLVAIPVAAALVVLVSAIPGRTAARLPIAEALRYE